LPALRVSLSDLRDGLTTSGRGSSGTVWRRFGSKLVVIELAMAVILLVGAGLLGKSFYRLLHVDTGIEPGHLAALQIAATSNAYSRDPQKVALERQLQVRLGALPGVQSVAFASRLPLGDGDGTTGFQIVGQPPDNVHREVAFRNVSANYFSTLQARLVRGRYFAEDEDVSKHPVIIINQQMATEYFAGKDPVGTLISLDGKTKIEIIAVINDIQEGQLDAAPRGAMYMPYNQNPSSHFGIVIRTTQQEDAVLPEATAAIHSVDPGLAVYDPVTMSERLHDSPHAALHRSSTWIVGGFAALALLLSVVGLYGVIAYSVSQRTREIGVRMALGAQRSAVYLLILTEAGRLAVAGIGAGLLCSLAATMLIRKLLFDVHAWDASILASVAVALAAAALLASYLPARRAASVNPTEALHAE
jgi:macrolide transport system ATP-binding/permease protein